MAAIPHGKKRNQLDIKVRVRVTVKVINLIPL